MYGRGRKRVPSMVSGGWRVLMRSRSWFVAMCLVVALPSSAAWADLHTPWQTFTYPAGYPIDLAALNWTQTWTVNQFDPAIGILTGIEIRFPEEAAGNMRVRNDAEIPSDIYGEQKVTLTLRRGSELLSTWQFTESHNWYNIPPGEWTDLYEWTESSSGSTLHTDNLSYWIGNSTLDLTVRAIGAVGGSGAGSLTFQSFAEKGVQYELRYTYLPEPGTMALVGLGLAGIGLWRKRRSRK